MTREEAIVIAVEFAEKYKHQEALSDVQAARIGRSLWALLKQADRDAEKAKGK